MGASIPTILVPGIGQNMVAYTGEDKKFESAWPPPLNPDTLKKEVTGAVMKLMIFRKDAGFSDKVAKIVSDAAEPFAVEADGTLRYEGRLRAVEYPVLSEANEKQKTNVYKFAPLQPLTAITGEDRLYFFSYNFAEDPFVTARALRSFTERVKAETGSDKVNLLPVGFGAPVTMAYLHEYGALGDIHRVVFYFCALDGSLLLTDVFTNSLVYTGFGEAIEQVSGASNASMLTDLNKLIPGLADSIAEKSLSVLCDKTLLRLPLAWSLVPSDDYEELAQELLAGNAALREKTDRFQAVRKAFPQTLQRLTAEGIGCYCLAGCGSRLLPLTPSQDVSSDGFINTSSAALNPSVLEDAEPAKQTIDASAGALPDTTWYFYGTQHMAAWRNPEAAALAIRLLWDDTLTDVHSPDAPAQFSGALPQ